MTDDREDLRWDDSWWVRNPNADTWASWSWDAGTYVLSGGWLAEAAAAATPTLEAGVQGGAQLVGQGAGGLAGGLAQGAAPGLAKAVEAAPMLALAAAAAAFLVWRAR